MEQIFSFRTVSVDIYLHKIKINKGVFKSFRTVSVDIYLDNLADIYGVPRGFRTVSVDIYRRLIL